MDAYVEKKVDFCGENPLDLAQQKYAKFVVERLLAAIQPNETRGEVPLLPILNRYEPTGTSANVAFLTARPCHGTEKSHVNQVVLDTETWERSACFWLEQSENVVCYVRNDRLGLSIPYEYAGVSHVYEPDFIVRFTNGVHLLLEIKGFETERELAKHEGAKRWVSAVNNWGKFGKWDFHVCHNPHQLRHELARFM